MKRIGVCLRFKDGKGRKFLAQKLIQKGYGELLAFIVPDIAEQEPAIRLKKLVILQVGRYKGISSGA